MNNFIRKGVQRLKYWLARGALVLVYHRVSESELDPWALSVTPEHFAEHLAVLRRSFHPTSLQALAQAVRGEANLRPRSIVITFDDGYADNLYHAKPLLERFDCPATVFIVTGVIGSPGEFWWDELASLLLQSHSLPERLDLSLGGVMHSWELGKILEHGPSDSPGATHWRAWQPAPSPYHALYLQLWKLIQPLSSAAQRDALGTLRAWAGNERTPVTHRLLNSEECVELSKTDQIEIGAHTLDHPSLASLTCDEQSLEISESKRSLENLLNQPVEAFSYPFGKRQDYNPETTDLVRQAGFSVACCNESGVVHSPTDVFQLPRIHIPDCNGAEFENHLLSMFYA